MNNNWTSRIIIRDIRNTKQFLDLYNKISISMYWKKILFGGKDNE